MQALSRDDHRPAERGAILPPRVLVVDDDPLTCELICEILRSAECEAASLTDSVEAAERLRREKFDAVFLDLRMPPPDGAELARQIRASRPNASTVIVMISGDEERSAGRQAFEAGVEFFLFKPVERNKLLKLIRAARGAIERERQRSARVMLRRRVSLESNSDRIDGATVDLSLGGALVESTRALAPSTRVTVILELELGRPPLRLDARVIRAAGTGRMSIQFGNLGASERRQLQDFLQPLILGG
jgi:CheY-like chemotaxis protein